MKMKEYNFYGWEQADVPAINDKYSGISTPLDLYDALSDVWCRETCAPRMRSDWSEENRTLGQCSITAFLVQDIFGGNVYGIPLENGNVHCYNDVGGHVFDLTSEQFGGETLNYSDNPEQDRAKHFSKDEKKERYELLRTRLKEKLSGKIQDCFREGKCTEDDRKELVWEEISCEHIVQDEWIDIRRSAYRFSDGEIFEPYYSYSRRDYVVIVASDKDGNYICVRQFRQGIKKVTTEFPAGGLERKDGAEYRGESGEAGSEDALEAAKRELREETGYESDEWKHLITVPSNATIADNYAYVFSAVNCRKVSGQDLDETEFLNIEKHTASEIEELIHGGGFQQSVHIMAWFLSKERNEV